MITKEKGPERKRRLLIFVEQLADKKIALSTTNYIDFKSHSPCNFKDQ